MGSVELPDGWSAHRLAALVEQRRITVPVRPDREYRLLGVRWYGDGVFHRETVTSETSDATALQPVTPGDLIYNRLFAWKGSFGLVPEEFRGCFVSGEFPLFCTRSGHDIRYVAYYFQQPWLWDYIAAESTGATAISRNRWREERLRNLVVPVPPLTAQQEIADYLDDEFGRIRKLLRVFSSAFPPIEGSLPALLLERRNTLVTHAVTGQLDLAKASA